MKRKKRTIRFFSSLLDIASRCFSQEAYFLCFLSVMSLFTGTALYALQRTLVLQQESPEVNRENIFTSCLMNSSIEMTIPLKNQYTESKKLWRLSDELRKTEHSTVIGLSEKSRYTVDFSYNSESTLIHTSSCLCSSFYMSPLIN